MFDLFVVIIFVICINIFLKGNTTPQSLKYLKKHWYTPAYDHTDDPDNKLRSGLSIYVDYETGIQYVSTRIGGIHPRLDNDGRLMRFKK